MKADETYEMWAALQSSLREKALPKSIVHPSAVLPTWETLNKIVADHGLLGLERYSLPNAVQRILCELRESFLYREQCDFPLPDKLKRVLIIRSGELKLLKALVDKIAAIQPQAILFILCHRKDEAAIRGLRDDLSLHPVFYPVMESFRQQTLTDILRRDIPDDVETAFYIDARLMGNGDDLQHVERAAYDAGWREAYLFNGSHLLLQTKALAKGVEGGEVAAQLEDNLRQWYASLSEQACIRESFGHTCNTTKFHNSHDVWEKIGQVDPYWGVISLDKFHQHKIDSNALQEFWRLGESLVDDLLKRIRLIDPDFQFNGVLDFGCGVGRLSRSLASRAAWVDAVDISASMRELCVVNCREAGFQNVRPLASDSTMECLLGRERPDLLVSDLVFQHIHPEEGIPLIARLVDHLAPGGWGYIYLLFESDYHQTPRKHFHDLTQLPEKIEMNFYDLNNVMAIIEENCDISFQAYRRQGDMKGMGLYFRRKGGYAKKPESS